jgi:putative tributyrin esterase
MRKALFFLGIVMITGLVSVATPAQERDGYTTIEFKSDVMSAKAPFNVILPVGYERSVRRYPVLLLLHGLTGHYDDWVQNTNVVLYARKYPLIIVMPEGGNGWYTNGVAANDRWEDYIVKEVIPYVNAHYRTLPHTRSWVVAGLSMGGYGAMKFGLKYPGMFAVAASMSGAVNAPTMKDSEMGTWEAVRTSLHAAYGPEGAPAHAANSLPVLLDAAKGTLPFLYLDCGTEDGLLGDNRTFADLLQSKKIPHEYRERPGIHDWIEWDHQVQEVLELIAEKLDLSWCDDNGLCAPGSGATGQPMQQMLMMRTGPRGDGPESPTPPSPPQR